MRWIQNVTAFVTWQVKKQAGHTLVKWGNALLVGTYNDTNEKYKRLKYSSAELEHTEAISKTIKVYKPYRRQVARQVLNGALHKIKTTNDVTTTMQLVCFDTFSSALAWSIDVLCVGFSNIVNKSPQILKDVALETLDF